MTETDIVAIGDCLAAGVYRLFSQHARVLNFANARHLLSIVHEDIGAGPCSIVVSNHAWPAWRGNLSQLVILNDHTLQFSHRQVFLGRARVYRSRISRLPMGYYASGARHLLALQSWLRCRPFAYTPPLHRICFEPVELHVRDYEQQFLEALNRDMSLSFDLRRAIKNLVGAGPGLTPAGDDFLAGALTALHFAPGVSALRVRQVAREIRRHAHRTTLLSRQLLRWAVSGRIFQRFRRLLDSWYTESVSAVLHYARSIMAWGHSSGEHWLLGFAGTLSRVWPERSSS